ncbi:LAMI_0D09956g1_1 [Lachancea mirantina]|uniref:LAMI_0D09956g1_1 n=1 Tax=Lachancea mirantina TaxID=1230905 RepID=A0A1G4JDZ6_9SACH|nr:LAMI_0D09956g1_1 [Lachancea mirantina]
MFSSNNGPSSLFGSGVTTSTPTSTPAQTNNGFLPGHKQATSGLFGAASKSFSTPTPPENLFGKNTSGNITANSDLNKSRGNVNGGFGMFGQPSTTTPLPLGSAATEKKQNTSLFPQSANSNTNNGGTSLFGVNNRISNNVSLPTMSTGSLFGNQNNDAIAPKPQGSLFGSQQMSGQAGGLFGASSSNQSAGSTKSTWSFNSGSNPSNVNTGLFGNTSLNGSSLSGTLQPQNGQNYGLSGDPYGLRVGSMPVNVTSMPESITAVLSKKGSKENSSLRDGKRSFSHPVAPNAIRSSSSSLISKLNSRMSSVQTSENVQGLFSPSSRNSGIADDVTRTSNNSSKRISGLTPMNIHEVKPLMKKVDLSDLRRLKIDSGRSAAKKMKLLKGISNTTKFQSLEEESDKKRKKEARSADCSSEIIIKSDSFNENAEEHSSSSCEQYWCSPSIDELVQLPVKQLCAVSNFVVGRKGFGSISFERDVDLSNFTTGLKESLFGKVIVFHKNKTVEVYPEEFKKPSLGYGLNVPATISLEKVFPVDKHTKLPIKNNSKPTDVAAFVRKLKKLKGMDFVTYNPFDGTWIFRVQHFSVWGIIDEEDVRIGSEDEAERQVEPKRAKSSRQAQDVFMTNSVGLDDASLRPGSFRGNNAVLRFNPNPSSLASDDLRNVNEELDSLIDEKAYEPLALSQHDFDNLVATPRLATSRNWLEQLKLCDLAERSIFRSAEMSKSKHMPFPEFEKSFRQYKDICRKMKMKGTGNFCSFSQQSTLLMKDSSAPEGFKVASLKSAFHSLQKTIHGIFGPCLTSSSIDVRESNGYPIISNLPLSFVEIASAFSATEDELRIWKLASILFDDTVLPMDGPRESAVGIIRRKMKYDNLCCWLVDSIKASVSVKLNETDSSNERVFLYLLIGDLISASKLAIESNNPHLAAVISLLRSNDPTVSHLAALQLNHWKTKNQNIDIGVKKTYQLLADPSKCQGDDCIKGLTWLEQFAIEVLYGNIDEKSLEELVRTSLKAVNLGNESSTEMTFNILSLYASQNNTDSFIRNVVFSKHQQDLHFPWLLLHILSAKGICNLPMDLADRLTLSYVEQLKVNNLQEEALYTTLFLRDDQLAKQQIDLLVTVLVSVQTHNEIYDLFEKLKIPSELVSLSIATYCRYQGNYVQEAEELLKGGLAKVAEDRILHDIAPKLILHETKTSGNLAVLAKLIDLFPANALENWEKGLGIYKNYLELALSPNKRPKFETLKSLLDGLPLLYSRQRKGDKGEVCCGLMAGVVCSAIMRNWAEVLKESTIKEKLLALPLGEPERMYLIKSLLT